MGRPEIESRPPRMYPRKSDINRAIQAAKANGILVGSIECAPDGTIRVGQDEQKKGDARSAFDRWNEAGKL